MNTTDLYRKLHTGNLGDVAFYERVCQGATRILELGCGWGRISLPLAQAGLDVVGVDNEPQFVAWAREALEKTSLPRGSARFVVADAAHLPSDFLEAHQSSFDRVLFPYNTIYALGGSAELARALCDARACLREDGELWLDVYDVDELHDALLSGEELPPDDDEPVASFRDGDASIFVTEKTEFAPRSNSLTVDYEAKHEQNIVARLSMVHHYLPQDGLIPLLEQSGFSVLVRTLGFPTPDDPEVQEDLHDTFGAQWVIGAVRSPA